MIMEDCHFYMQGFGVPVVITLSDGSLLNIDNNGNILLGIFDNCFFNPELGNTVIVTNEPKLTIPSEDIIAVQVHNTVLINNINYDICFINNDGTGMTVLDLVKC